MDLSPENIRNGAAHCDDIANRWLRPVEANDVHLIADMLRELASLEAENNFFKTIIKAQSKLINDNEQTNSQRPKNGQTVKT